MSDDLERVTNESLEVQLEKLAEELTSLYTFRDLFFETHPLDMAKEKHKMIIKKMDTLEEKFNEIDENQLNPSLRANYLYLKGRLYNISPIYDPRASQCLSKAVKLNPKLVPAWNELGECYWKNTNIKDAKSTFEMALKHERDRVSLRSLSIVLRQASTNKPGEHQEAIEKSVELAKEAVAQDPKDGLSWCVLGNAHLCKYFLVAQEPATLKACMTAYKQAALDPVARGQSDLYYNSGVAHKYNEQYTEALDDFERSRMLDPVWDVPGSETYKLEQYLSKVNDLLKTKGKIKTKKLQSMVQSIDDKMLGAYADNLKRTPLSELSEGENAGAVVLGKVVGSVLSDDMVPFTFGLTDESMCCISVTVYNWAQRGVIIGDTVAIPSPLLRTITVKDYNYKTVRINNPLTLLINGKKMGRNEFAGTRVTSTYEIPTESKSNT